jgi:arylsulfatase A-like enzyme
MNLLEPIRKKALLFFLVFVIAAAWLLFYIPKNNHDAGEVNRKYPVIIVFFDGLRYDFLDSCDSQDLARSNICQLAGEGLVFKNHFSQSKLFSGSLISFLTSTDKNTERSKKENPDKFYLPLKKTLFSAVLGAGYETAVFMDASTIARKYLRNLGSDHAFINRDIDKRFADIHKWILQNHDKNLLAMVHCKVPRKIKSFKLNDYPKETLRHYYNKDIADIDLYLGRLFGLLKFLDKWDDSIIIITSARGLSRDFNRDTGSYPAKKFPIYSLRIPLIIKVPKAMGLSKKRVFENTSSLDVMPTVLDLLGIPIGADTQGRSLLKDS